VKLVRIPWREVVKMFALGARAVHCTGCKAEDRHDWYVTQDNLGPYCPSCAAKLAQGEDTTRSVTQFYSNTTGTQVEAEHLEEA